jgi:hypothetical protein
MKRTRNATKPQLRLEEEQAWSGFLSAAPLFAGEEIACWHQGPEPPDVLCTTVSGRVVGIELTVWVDQEQIQSGKIRERFETAYLSNVASERESRPANIGWIWLYDKHHSIKPVDKAAFRQELYSCIAEQSAIAEPDWEDPQGAPVTNFDLYPKLKKYLDSIGIFPRDRMPRLAPDCKWILFEEPGGAYTHEWMVNAALDRIRAKIDKYGKLAYDLRVRHGLNELYLLCHYDDRALRYNTPIHTVGFSYSDLAAKIAERLEKDHGVFDKIFLFHPWESPSVMGVWPPTSPSRSIVGALGTRAVRHKG